MIGLIGHACARSGTRVPSTCSVVAAPPTAAAPPRPPCCSRRYRRCYQTWLHAYIWHCKRWWPRGKRPLTATRSRRSCRPWLARAFCRLRCSAVLAFFCFVGHPLYACKHLRGLRHPRVGPDIFTRLVACLATVCSLPCEQVCRISSQRTGPESLNRNSFPQAQIDDCQYGCTDQQQRADRNFHYIAFIAPPPPSQCGTATVWHGKFVRLRNTAA